MDRHKALLSDLLDQIRRFYGSSLVTVAVFGSVARKTATPDSDIDVLIVAENLPSGRVRRVDDFLQIEKALSGEIETLGKEGFNVYLSPVIKTPEEVQLGSPLFWDMIYDVMILYDKGNFFANYLQGLKKRLEKLGARRIVQGERWYWDLKPDYQPGDVFDL